MDGKIERKERYVMPHGSYQEGTIKYWKIPKGIPHDDINDAFIGIFRYSTNWNCLIPVIEEIENLEIDEEVFRFIFHKKYKRCII